MALPWLESSMMANTPRTKCLVCVGKLQTVVAQLTKHHDAIHVKAQEVFDAAATSVNLEHWILHRVHWPQGHELIARNWLQQVRGRFSQ